MCVTNIELSQMWDENGLPREFQVFETLAPAPAQTVHSSMALQVNQRREAAVSVRRLIGLRMVDMWL